MQKFETYVDLIKEAKKVTVLTGAGISTASGLPDFRSKKGLYNENPEKILSRNFFFNFTGNFYDFFEKSLYFPNILPNEAHKILAKWEEEGNVKCVITQNIDGLHQSAGSKNVIEYHGTIKTATCFNPKCQKKYTIEELLNRKKEKEDFWECNCGTSSTRRYIKPDIVLFGEVGKWMQGKYAEQVFDEIYKSDLLLVLGSSLQVYPFNSFIRYRNPKAKVLIINKGETSYDNDTSIFKIEDDIVSTLRKINTLIKKDE